MNSEVRIKVRDSNLIFEQNQIQRLLLMATPAQNYVVENGQINFGFGCKQTIALHVRIANLDYNSRK